MHDALPPLNALRAFEAAARHLSLTRAARELNVTPGALSHQIRGLEEFLGLKLFERRVRAIALTRAGRQLYPGLQTGFLHIREAVAGLRPGGDPHVLVISTPPGFTAKWLAPRLYRFSSAHPAIDARVSSSSGLADFTTDGVDVGLRNLSVHAAPDPTLVLDKLMELSLVPVCSPALIAAHGPFTGPQALRRVPLIHDDSLAGKTEIPTWTDWLKAAGVDGIDVRRGLRFSSADHALDATAEGAGILLAHDVLAYDDLRTGRLVRPFALTLPTGRAYYFACARHRQDSPNVQAFHAWVKAEVAALDWSRCAPAKVSAGTDAPAR